MICWAGSVQHIFNPEKPALDHAGYTAHTQQPELDLTDQECLCLKDPTDGDHGLWESMIRARWQEREAARTKPSPATLGTPLYARVHTRLPALL